MILVSFDVFNKDLSDSKHLYGLNSVVRSKCRKVYVSKTYYDMIRSKNYACYMDKLDMLDGYMLYSEQYLPKTRSLFNRKHKLNVIGLI